MNDKTLKLMKQLIDIILTAKELSNQYPKDIGLILSVMESETQLLDFIDKLKSEQTDRGVKE